MQGKERQGNPDLYEFRAARNLEYRNSVNLPKQTEGTVKLFAGLAADYRENLANLPTSLDGRTERTDAQAEEFGRIKGRTDLLNDVLRRFGLDELADTAERDSWEVRRALHDQGKA